MKIPNTDRGGGLFSHYKYVGEVKMKFKKVGYGAVNNTSTQFYNSARGSIHRRGFVLESVASHLLSSLKKLGSSKHLVPNITTLPGGLLPLIAALQATIWPIRVT